MNTIKEHKRADLVLDARAVALKSRAATRRKRSLVHLIGREMSAPHATGRTSADDGHTIG